MAVRGTRITAIPVVASLLVVGATGWLSGCSSAPEKGAAGPKAEIPYQPPRAPQTPDTKPGADPKAAPTAPVAAPGQRIHSCFLTRTGSTAWQSQVYYEASQVPSSEVPGLSEITARLALLGQPPPSRYFALQRESELRVDNLGQVQSSLVSSRYFVNPLDNVTMAYDVAITEGGLPQRLVGSRTKTGVSIEFYRGSEKVDRREVEFPPGIEIFPITLDFIHYSFTRRKDLKELEASFFLPELASFMTLRARPLGKELLAHQGRNRECARYEIFTGAYQAPANAFARQRVWFDLETGGMLRRTDAEPDPEHGEEEVVTERVEPEKLHALEPLVVRPPVLPDKSFPYALNRELVYTVRIRESVLGKVRISFFKQSADQDGPAGYMSRARLDLEMPTAQRTRRQEEAITRYDEHFQPLSYQVTGEELLDTVSDYSMTALFKDGQVRLKLNRSSRAEPAVPEPVPATQKEAAPNLPTTAWQDPLRRVTLRGEAEPDAPPPPPRPSVKNEQFARPLTRGTFIYDFHRLEHLAVVACRFNLPAPDGKPVSQMAAFFSVRQNQAARVAFTVAPEPRPAREPDADAPAEPGEKDPVLFIAATGNPLMPSRMLLTPDGRLLQFSSQYGAQEIIYTLDDPIMVRRAERERQHPSQDGPVLLRPPWF
jgi:hypothetical protein